jgi:hypothetical protein
MSTKEVLTRLKRMGEKRDLELENAGFEELNLIRLSDALLCANCELIVNESFNGGCPACGSHALMQVSTALGGTLDEPRARHALPELSSFYSQGLEN